MYFMLLKIIQVGDPLLRQKTRELSKEEILSPSIQQLIQLMKKTMDDAPGVGLAAPQIGESLQLIVIEDKQEFTQGLTEEQIKQRERSPVPFHVIINPKIILDNTESVEFYEGCLSSEGFVGIVPRARKVTVECLNEQAMPVTIHASGWYARILQHEIDHLHGTLCIDRTKMQSLTTFENYIRYWKNPTK
jgi:peptide deformylase